MPVVPITMGSGPNKIYGLLSYRNTAELAEYNAQWNEFLSGLTNSRHRFTKKWRGRKNPRREHKKEIKQMIRQGVNHIEIEASNPLFKSREIRRIKNMLGHALSKKVTIS